MEPVVIAVDPHKLSVTIEVIDRQEQLLGVGRFSTDKAGFAAMRSYAKQWPDREWAIEGALGVGRPLAQRLMEAGERVLDVPAKLAARARLLDTGHGRKTDAHDAHSVAVAAVRAKNLRVLAPDGQLEALRMLADRREELTRQRVQTVNRLQRLLSELTPGKAKKDLTALQAKEILARVRPRDIAGKTRRRLAAEQLAELVAVEKKIKTLTKELKAMVIARGSTLMDLPGVGPVVAARILADVGDVSRFANRNRFASWTGTAPLDASSGEQIRHRLSRAGNRKMNHMLHIAAATQVRLDTDGRAYFRTSDASSPRARPGWRPCAASSGASLTPSTVSSSPTPRPPSSRPGTSPPSSRSRRLARVREGTAGRLKNPARSTFPRTSTLRISHFPDPRNRRYNRPSDVGRPPPRTPSRERVDNRGEPE
jgi:transposase